MNFLLIFGDCGVSCFVTKNCSKLFKYLRIYFVRKTLELVLENLPTLGNGES